MAKKKDTVWVLVEAVGMFRHRYVIESPTNLDSCGPVEFAEDTVTMQEAKEFSQEFLGENIISSRVISSEEVISLCDADNDYASCWPDKQKKEVFATTMKELEIVRSKE